MGTALKMGGEVLRETSFLRRKQWTCLLALLVRIGGRARVPKGAQQVARAVPCVSVLYSVWDGSTHTKLAVRTAQRQEICSDEGCGRFLLRLLLRFG